MILKLPTTCRNRYCMMEVSTATFASIIQNSLRTVTENTPLIVNELSLGKKFLFDPPFNNY